MAFNVRDAIAAAKNKGPNMSEASAGGGYEQPAEGFTRLRFVGYYELGEKEGTWQGKKTVKPKADLVFELSGPKHPPRDTDNGKIPMRITVGVNTSKTGQLSENSVLFKLFSAMNWEGKATHIAELLSNDFVAEVKHNQSKINGKDVTFANLENIRKPFIQSLNSETGEVTDQRIAVDPALTEIKLYIWDQATPEMWDAIYIPGEYEARKDKDGNETAPAKSKNVIQNKIRAALNFKASPIYDYAMGKVSAVDAKALDEAVGETETPVDPLDGIA